MSDYTDQLIEETAIQSREIEMLQRELNCMRSQVVQLEFDLHEERGFSEHLKHKADELKKQLKDKEK